MPHSFLVWHTPNPNAVSTQPAQPADVQLPPMSLMELAFLLHAVWGPARHGDVIARALFRKLRASIEGAGIPWPYAQPWVD